MIFKIKNCQKFAKNYERRVVDGIRVVRATSVSRDGAKTTCTKPEPQTPPTIPARG
jgi:hypothetical protein